MQTHMFLNPHHHRCRCRLLSGLRCLFFSFPTPKKKNWKMCSPCKENTAQGIVIAFNLNWIRSNKKHHSNCYQIQHRFTFFYIYIILWISSYMLFCNLFFLTSPFFPSPYFPFCCCLFFEAVVVAQEKKSFEEVRKTFFSMSWTFQFEKVLEKVENLLFFKVQ